MQLFEGFTDPVALESAEFIKQTMPTTTLTESEVTQAWLVFSEVEQLTEEEALQARKNKRLVQRFRAFLKALEQHQRQQVQAIVKQELDKR